jgi:hypothetical protein
MLQMSGKSSNFAAPFQPNKQKQVTTMNEKDQKQQGLQIELTPDKAQGEYANFAIITHSS